MFLIVYSIIYCFPNVTKMVKASLRDSMYPVMHAKVIRYKVAE